MARFGWLALGAVLVLAACASPQVVGQQVGQSLYNASVSTGNALANFQDRTGQALQNAGTNLRQSSNPPPPAPLYQPDYGQHPTAPQVPVQSEPLN